MEIYEIFDEDTGSILNIEAETLEEAIRISETY